MMDREGDPTGVTTSATKFKLRSHFVSVSTPSFRRATSAFFRW